MTDNQQGVERTIFSELHRIMELARADLNRCANALKCAHEWREYGHGYVCGKCYTYTGTNSTLNDAIKQLDGIEPCNREGEG